MRESILSLLVAVLLGTSVVLMNSSTQAYAATFTPGSVLNLGTGSSGAYPTITVAGSNLYSAFSDGSDIYLRRSTDGGSTFSSPVNLSNNAGTSTNPQISSSGTNVFVVWQDSTTGSGDIYFKKSTDSGATFGSIAVNLSNSTGTSSNAQIASVGNNVYVVWQDSTTGSGDIYFKKSTDGGSTWSTMINLSNNAGTSSSPQIASTGTNVYVTWQDGGDIYFKKSTDSGATFGSNVNISSSVGGSSLSPLIAISGGYVHIVWTENADIYYSRSTDSGSTFSTPKDLYAFWWDSNSPSLAVSGSNVYIVYIDTPPSSGPNVFYTRSTDNGATFETVIDISNNYSQILLPRVAADGTNVYVTWLEPMLTSTGSREYDVLYQYSTDSGKTFSYTTLWSDNSKTVDSKENAMVAAGGSLYMVWNEYNSPVNVFFRKGISPTSADTTPPIVTVPSNMVVATSNIFGAVVTFTATATDNIDGALTPTCTPASGSTFPISTTTVNCSATDSAGNTGTASFIVTVTYTDTAPPSAPVISSPVSGTTTTDNTPTFTGTAEASSTVSLYDGSNLASITSTAVSSTGSWSVTLPTALSSGVHSVTAKATDAAGNTSPASSAVSITITLTASDTTAPVLTVPSSMTVEATSSTGAVVTFTATATDNIDGALTPTCTPASGSTFPISTTTVNCSATDSAGNTGTASFTVTVRDITAPRLTLPSSMTVEASSASGAIVSFVASATDLVDGSRTVICTPASGSTFPLGTTTVLCSASDTRGNSATGSFTVTVKDTTAPSVSITSPTTGQTISGMSTVSVTASDKVGLSSVELYMDGNYYGTDSVSPYTFSVDTTTLPDGQHQFSAKAIDKLNNAANSQPVAPMVQNSVNRSTPPNVSITSPLGGSTVKGTVPITVSVSDSDGIAKLAIFVDGTLVTTLTPASATTSTTFTFSWDSTSVANGSHTITATAYDSQNTNGSDSVTVKVQNKGTGGGKGGPKPH